jgi:hypothetical protein
MNALQRTLWRRCYAKDANFIAQSEDYQRLLTAVNKKTGVN